MKIIDTTLKADKMHREMSLHTDGLCCLAQRAMSPKFVQTGWRAERLAERNQIAWATRPRGRAIMY